MGFSQMLQQSKLMVPLSPPTNSIRFSGSSAKLVNTPRNVSERSFTYEWVVSMLMAPYTPIRFVGVPTISSGPLLTRQWTGSWRFLLGKGGWMFEDWFVRWFRVLTSS